MVSVAEESFDNELDNEVEEVSDLPKLISEKTFKEKFAEYEEQLCQQSQTIIGHVRYLCVEFWGDQDCAESWAHETIDMIELYISLDFQRHAARFIMEEMQDMPLAAKKHIRKYFDLWT